MIAETVFVLAGLGAGLLYAFSGFSDVKQTQTLDKNPRVQNLKYAASVLPTAIIADVGKLGSATSAIPLTAYYVAATIVAALLSIGGIASFFAYSHKKLARADERYRAVQHSDLVMTYLHWGFAAYREAKDRVIAGAHVRILPAHEALWNFNGLLVAERRYLSEKSLATKEFVINEILRAMSTNAEALLSHVPKATFVANYMIPFEWAAVTEEHRKVLKFGEQPLDGYSHLLVLMSYQDNVTKPTISLPIRAKGDYVLPGAPEAFTTRQSTWMTKDPVFPPKSSVPKELQKQIRDYLKVAKFESFVSLPLMLSGKCVGIVNVESEGADAFSEQAHTERLVQALQPHCTLLARICGAGEDQ